jgi:hypothetical protein
MKSSRGNQKPRQRTAQTIQVPISHVTPDPKPGYTPEDFWRELGGDNPEFDQFKRLATGLLAVPKSEVDKKREES